VRTLLGVAVIVVGIAWHRVLGVVAIATGLLLCGLMWLY
jgi:hypothetical protein